MILEKYMTLALVLGAAACTHNEQVQDPLETRDSRNYVVSLSNQGPLLHSVPVAEAKNLRKKIETKKSADTEALQTRLSLGRWGRENFQALKIDAKNLVELEMRKGIDKDISEATQFDLLVSAYYGQEWADFWQIMDDLSASKNPKTQALVANLRGVLAWEDNNFSEAGVYFQQALKANPKHASALINLAYLNLTFGYTEEAELYLSRIPQDPLAQSGRIITAYLLGKSTEASNLCDAFLEKFPKHKSTLFNCAQIAFYGAKDKQRAQDFLEKAIRLPAEDKIWDLEASKLLKSLKEKAEASKTTK